MENRGGMLSGEVVLRAPPDSYTLLLAGTSLWLASFMRKSASYVVRIPCIWRNGASSSKLPASTINEAQSAVELSGKAVDAGRYADPDSLA